MQAVTRDVHASIAQLRTEIHRLRGRSRAHAGGGVGARQPVEADLLHVLREVDLLRAELHEAVGAEASVERLPRTGSTAMPPRTAR